MTCMGTAKGWDTIQPISDQCGCDVLTKKGIDDSKNYVKKVDPDMMTAAWPCWPWSDMQNVTEFKYPQTWKDMISVRKAHMPL